MILFPTTRDTGEPHGRRRHAGYECHQIAGFVFVGKYVVGIFELIHDVLVVGVEEEASCQVEYEGLVVLSAILADL